MLGTLVLVFLQLLGSWWLTKRILEVIPVFGPLKLAFIVITASLLTWIIGILSSEVIKEVDKPSRNALISAFFVSAVVVAVNVIPLFSVYAIHVRETYLPGIGLNHIPILGAVLGYHLSK